MKKKKSEKMYSKKKKKKKNTYPETTLSCVHFVYFFSLAFQFHSIYTHTYYALWSTKSYNKWNFGQQLITYKTCTMTQRHTHKQTNKINYNDRLHKKHTIPKKEWKRRRE